MDSRESADAIDRGGRAASSPSDLLAQARAHLANREYWASETTRGLQAPNRAHSLRTYFEPTGIRVHDRMADEDEPLVGLSIARLGRGDSLAAVPAGRVDSERGRVEIARRELGLVEWFENSPQGIEQGFDLATRPAAEPSGGHDDGELVIELAITGAQAARRAGEVVLTSKGGRRLAYEKLRVVDAGGVELAARFEIPAPDRIRILVDDARAEYPIVVDPLLKATIDGLLESNQVDAFFGQGMAPAGDVNGDGHADVIIGAPLYDAGNTDEGAAFIFHGSAAGLVDGNPATAATQLESNTGVAFLGPNFGRSVSSAGDVNGDGFDDVIVGAPSYGAGGAFVFLGSASGVDDGHPGTAHARLTSTEFESNFGASVASAGDVNGDGFDDVLVGAPLYDAPAFNAGAAFVFLGSGAGIADATPATAHAVLGSDQAGFPSGSVMGTSVASAGDVNGDGYDDVVIGAPRYGLGGGAFVHLGSPMGIASALPAAAHARLSSVQAGASMGISVAGAGDTNGDGYADVLVGASGMDHGQSDEGAVLVFAGSPSGVASGDAADALTWLEPDQNNAALGQVVAGVGDINGDGYADIGTASGGFISGVRQVHVYLGTSSGVPSGNFSTLVLRFAQSFLGNIASAGDLNDDGYGDVLIGFAQGGAGETGEGLVTVLLGGSRGFVYPAPSAQGVDEARALLVSNQPDAVFGTAVASAGDVNGDGRGDVLVGAPDFDSGQPDEGAAFLFLGTAAGLPDLSAGLAQARFEGEQAGARMGSSVASAGDVDGDGYGDVVIGARLWDAGETDEGGAFVFLGSATGIASGNPATAHARFQSNWAFSELGASVASAGDVNGDGYADVIVGAPRQSAGEAFEGVAFVFNGSATGLADGDPFTTFGWIQSDQDLAELGTSVASAGDVNGDGYGDVVVGSPGYSTGQGAEEGSAFVFHGGPSGIFFANPTNAAARIDADQGTARLGASVAAAGDVNGDGFGDVVIGAPLYDAGHPDEGAAFVYLGSPSGIGAGIAATADAQIESDQAGAQLGAALASLGDLYGDGFAAIAVGAPRFDDGDRDEGMALVFPGSASGIADGNAATAIARIAADQPDALLGSSLASAGDLDGDGVGDLILGAPQYATGQPGEGAAFGFLGNTIGDTLLGRSSFPRQRRGDGTGRLVAPAGAAFAVDRFYVELLARSPRGREFARLEVEACRSGLPFGDAGCQRQTMAAWVDLGTTGALIGHTVTGLVAETTYAWRVRALYAPPTPVPGPGTAGTPGPWFRQQSVTTTDIRTVPEPGGIVALAAGSALIAAVGRRRGARSAR